MLLLHQKKASPTKPQPKNWKKTPTSTHPTNPPTIVPCLVVLLAETSTPKTNQPGQRHLGAVKPCSDSSHLPRSNGPHSSSPVPYTSMGPPVFDTGEHETNTPWKNGMLIGNAPLNLNLKSPLWHFSKKKTGTCSGISTIGYLRSL